MNKNFDHVISTPLRDTKAYDPYFNKFNRFFANFLTPKERDLHELSTLMNPLIVPHEYIQPVEVQCWNIFKTLTKTINFII